MAIADVSSKSIAELVSLEGRVAVVTGGAQGLGRAMVNRLAEAGASVATACESKCAAMVASPSSHRRRPSRAIASRFCGIVLRTACQAARRATRSPR